MGGFGKNKDLILGKKRDLTVFQFMSEKGLIYRRSYFAVSLFPKGFIADLYCSNDSIILGPKKSTAESRHVYDSGHSLGAYCIKRRRGGSWTKNF